MNFSNHLLKICEKVVDTEIKQDKQDLIIFITGIVTALATKFFRVYIHSTEEEDFIFCEQLSYLGGLDNINTTPNLNILQQSIVQFSFRTPSKLCFACEEFMNEGLTGEDSQFIFDVQDKMTVCLRTVSELIPIQQYLNDAVSLISTDPCDSSRIESCLFFITGLIGESHFPIDCNETLEMILNTKPDAPSPLIEAYCRILKDLIPHIPEERNLSSTSEIGHDSIYKWLALVPETASKLNDIDEEDYEERVEQLNEHFEYINNILILCHEIREVENLARSLGNVLENFASSDDVIYVLDWVVDFYSKTLFQDFENNPNKSDSSRLTRFIMTAFAIITKSMDHIFVQPHELVTLQKTFSLCFKVMNHCKDNEEICERTCDVLRFIINIINWIYYDLEDISKQFPQLYRSLGYSCVLIPFGAIIGVVHKHGKGWDWFLKDCKVSIYLI
ncbi:hypothetical protein RF11_06332 [Thelohanellus kitauei]|uniref:Uncharacterized protein n=1 Tax=Thelohanellus kitauei TaxID=669202 RepID=A0A0C2MC49_THEKT|nr:hypothetical protein RF11_06332 [Thelohanellus kitauei]